MIYWYFYFMRFYWYFYFSYFFLLLPVYATLASYSIRTKVSIVVVIILLPLPPFVTWAKVLASSCKLTQIYNKIYNVTYLYVSSLKKCKRYFHRTSTINPKWLYRSLTRTDRSQNVPCRTLFIDTNDSSRSSLPKQYQGCSEGYGQG